MKRRTFGPLAAAALVALCALSATGGTVDVQLRGKNKVSGTLRPATDVEGFTCDLVTGTTLVASVKGKTKGGPAVTLGLTLDGDPVEGANFTPKGTGGAMKFKVEDNGLYVVNVAGDGVKDGDYDLTVSWKAQTKFTVPGGPTAQDEDDFFTFSAPAGALATIDVVKAGHSAFKGSLVDVEDADGNALLDLSEEQRSHALFLVPTSGDYSVGFTNVGGDGEWIGKVKLKVPKTKSTKIDIRDSVLGGAFKDDNTVFGRILGPDGGEITFDSGGAGSPLDGTSIQIPANSLGGPTIITIAATTPFNPGEGIHAAGPAVDLGPSGTSFTKTNPPDQSKQAKVTIPFDPSYFPGGDTTNLVIYVRNADGTQSAIDRPYDFTSNSVSFFTSHLSTYQPGTTNVRPFEGNFVAIEFGGELQSNYEGSFGVGLHAVTAADGVADIADSEAKITWLDFGSEGSVADGFLDESAAATLDVTVPDDATVTLTDNSVAPPDGVTFFRGTNDDVLVGRKRPIVLLRRARGTPTVSLISGQWHLFGLEFQVRPNDGNSPSDVSLQLKGEQGTVSMTPDGKLALVGNRQVSSQSNFPHGTWSSLTQNKPNESGVPWSVADGKIVVAPPGDNPFEFIPVLGGNVLVGRQLDFGEGGQAAAQGFQPKTVVGGSSDQFVELIVLVRKSATTKSAFAGAYRFMQYEVETVDRPTGGSQGLSYEVADVLATIASNGNVTITGLGDFTTHDSNGAPITTIDQDASGAAKLTLKTDGSFTGPDGNLGALAIGGGLVIRTAFKDGRFEFAFGAHTLE